MNIKFNLSLIILLLASFMPLSVYGEETTAYVRLVDDAGLLTEEQAQQLSEKLDEVSERQELDVIIITVDSIDGYTPTEFADDTFDYNGFGMGYNKDGILLLLSMEERDWAISTHGYGITVFTDAGQEYIVDKFIGHISNGEYYEGFGKFIDLADEFITQAETDAPYDTNNLPEEPVSLIWVLLIAVGGGVVIALIITGVMRSSLKSVTKQSGASNYIVNTVMPPFAQKDLYLYSVVTKTEKPKDTGGGSSTHTSSSGGSHGGSSGKF